MHVCQFIELLEAIYKGLCTSGQEPLAEFFKIHLWIKSDQQKICS